MFRTKNRNRARLSGLHGRVLEGREQKTLVRIWEKLRKGDVMKFVSKITHEDMGGREFARWS
jgi:hypothetical protein